MRQMKRRRKCGRPSRLYEFSMHGQPLRGAATLV
jgi:hypothetical protein